MSESIRTEKNKGEKGVARAADGSVKSSRPGEKGGRGQSGWPACAGDEFVGRCGYSRNHRMSGLPCVLSGFIRWIVLDMMIA